MSHAECLIVGAAPRAGEEGFYGSLLPAYRVVIAADAAGEWCVARGRRPDVVVGDFDSAAAGAVARLRAAGCRVVEIPRVKDVTDLDAALTEARAMGVSRIDFCAAFEDRVDHTLASLGTMLRAADLGARVIEPGWSAWALDGRTNPRVELALADGATFSVLSPGGAAGVTVTGADYPLDDARVGALSGLGVSNVARGEGAVVVSVGSGVLLVIAAR